MAKGKGRTGKSDSEKTESEEGEETMKNETGVIPQTGSTSVIIPPQQEPPTNLLAVIAQAVTDPRVDIEKMERLLVMHQTITQENRKVAFMAALAEIQAKVPQINKEGRIVVKGTERSRYAKIEDIDLAIRPLLAENGFSFSFDQLAPDTNGFTLVCKLSHREGHSETKSLFLPIDKSDFRSAVQSIGSTVSYGKRQLIKMHLNIVERDEDDDGNGGSEPITKEQVLEIRTLLADTKSNEAKFLELVAGVPTIEQIPARDLKRIMNALETKARGQRK